MNIGDVLYTHYIPTGYECIISITAVDLFGSPERGIILDSSKGFNIGSPVGFDPYDARLYEWHEFGSPTPGVFGLAAWLPTPKYTPVPVIIGKRDAPTRAPAAVCVCAMRDLMMRGCRGECAK